MRAAAHTLSPAAATNRTQLTASCQIGTTVAPHRIRIVRNEVVGNSVSATISGLSGWLKINTVRNKGIMNSMLVMPLICCPCCASVTMPPIATMIPATSA